jgi:hypothetical protein
MPTGATRLRRDFVSLLSLVRAHAILYQAQRDREHHGRTVATVEGDYEPVRALTGDLIAEGVEASVPARTRETVEVVRSRRGLPTLVGRDRPADVRRAFRTELWFNHA